MANKPGMEPLEPNNFQYEEFLSDLHKNIFNNKSTIFNYQKQKEYEPIDVTPVTVLNIHYSRNMKTFNFSYYYIIQNTLSDHAGTLHFKRNQETSQCVYDTHKNKLWHRTAILHSPDT